VKNKTGTIFAFNFSMARITYTTIYNTTMHYLQSNGEGLNKLNEQIASTKKINRPSDNPIGFSNALNYGDILNSLSQQKINMDDGEIYMNALETAHKSLNNLFERTQELAVQAANDPMKHQERLFINMEVRENLEHLVSLAQTKHKDNYIFSGKWTNQPPYEIKNGVANFRAMPANVPVNPLPMLPDDPGPFENTEPIRIQLFDAAYIDPNIMPLPDNPMVQRVIPGSVSGLESFGLQERGHSDPIDEPDYEIDYAEGTLILLSERAKAAFYNDDGTAKAQDLIPGMEFEYVYRNSIDMSGEIYREIDTGITMKINTNPDDIFGKDGLYETDSFKEMIKLMEGLWYNDQPKISKGIDEVDSARQRNLEQQAIEGARQSRLSIVYDRNAELGITNTDAKSRIEDIDVAEAFSEFSLADAIYNASLQVASRLMQRTLMDYMR
jgi:flagellar hook-associated protein 3 FlgL